LDDLILKHAQQSKQIENRTASYKTKNNWRPWLAAASVVLVVPMIWLLTQNQQLSQDFGQLQSKEVQPKTTQDASPKAEKSFADNAGIEAEMSEQDSEEQGKITITDSRIRSEPEAPAPMADLQDMIEQQGQRSITGKPIDQESLQANKELLMNEFKVKKRTIKPSTMDPLMALEYEQFGRYLERGEIEAADQLLTEMQENWSDFDFEDMIYRLAEAEVKN